MIEPWMLVATGLGILILILLLTPFPINVDHRLVQGKVLAIEPVQKVPHPPDWSSRAAWFKADLESAIGAEFIGTAEDQPFIRANLPKRSSRKK